MEMQRVIELDMPVNFRDLGGYQGLDGRRVKWRKIYRSAALNEMSARDRVKLANLRITVDCDLRSSREQRSYPDLLWPGVRFVNISLYAEGDRFNQTHPFLRLFHHLPEFDDYLPKIYQQVLLNEHSEEGIKRVFEELLKLPEDQALVYHCAAGKDRTGIISILILMALGVDDKTIAEDYLLTDELYDFSIEKQHPTNEKLSQVIAKMNVTRGEGPAVKGITETIRHGWGSFDKFFTRKLGFKQADLEKFREMYLEEEEED